jgi:hypothetical protein
MSRDIRQAVSKPRPTSRAVTKAVTIPILIPVQARGRNHGPADDFFSPAPADKEGVAYTEWPPEDEREVKDLRAIYVRRFLEEDLDRSSGRAAKTLRQIDSSSLRDTLNLVELVRATKAGDLLASQKALIKFREARIGSWVANNTRKLINDPKTQPGLVPRALVGHLTAFLIGVRLVIWQWQDQLAPALLCPDVGTALLVHYVMCALGGRAGMRLCPKCSQAFVQNRADQTYCSIKCREAHRVERWRARKAMPDKTAAKRSIRGERK